MTNNNKKRDYDQAFSYEDSPESLKDQGAFYRVLKVLSKGSKKFFLKVSSKGSKKFFLKGVKSSF